MQLDHPQHNTQIDQMQVDSSLNMLAAGGLVVKLEVDKLWSEVSDNRINSSN